MIRVLVSNFSKKVLWKTILKILYLVIASETQAFVEYTPSAQAHLLF